MLAGMDLNNKRKKRKMTIVTHCNIDYNDTRWDELAELTREVRDLNWKRYGLLLEWDEIVDMDYILTGDQIDRAINTLRREAAQLK